MSKGWIKNPVEAGIICFIFVVDIQKLVKTIKQKLGKAAFFMLNLSANIQRLDKNAIQAGVICFILVIDIQKLVKTIQQKLGKAAFFMLKISKSCIMKSTFAILKIPKVG